MSYEYNQPFKTWKYNLQPISINFIYFSTTTKIASGLNTSVLKHLNMEITFTLSSDYAAKKAMFFRIFVSLPSANV